MKPRLLLVSRRQTAQARLAVLERELDVHVVSGSYPFLALRVARALRRLRPCAILAQSPYEAAAALLSRSVTRVRAPVILDVHGDWRTATRLYGSRARILAAPLADIVSRVALRHADAVRTVSPFTSGLVRELGVEPTATFPAYMDVASFTDRPPQPLPAEPSALFVGVLERYKGFDVLADAWRLAAPRTRGAPLRIVGAGSLASVAERLLRDVPQTTWSRRLTPSEVARALDESWVLVLPSRSEGLGRVIVEAFSRGRPVLGARAGSIPDLVEDGVTGVLVEAGRPEALADALVALLSDRARVERLAAAAATAAAAWMQAPDAWAKRVRELVESTSAV